MLNLFDSIRLQQVSAQNIPSPAVNIKAKLCGLLDGSFPLEIRDTYTLNHTLENLKNFSFQITTASCNSRFIIMLCVLGFLLIFTSVQKAMQGKKYMEIAGNLIIIYSVGFSVFSITAIPVTFVHYSINAFGYKVENPNLSFALVFTAVCFFGHLFFERVSSDDQVCSTIVSLSMFLVQFETFLVLTTICSKFVLLLLGENRRQHIVVKIKSIIKRPFNASQGILLAFLPIMVITGESAVVSTSSISAAAEVANETVIAAQEAQKAAAEALAKPAVLNTAAQAGSLVSSLVNKVPFNRANVGLARTTHITLAGAAKLGDAVYWAKINRMKMLIRPTVVSNWYLPGPVVEITDVVPNVRVLAQPINSNFPTPSEKFMKCPVCKLKMDWSEINTPTGIPNRFTRTITTSHCVTLQHTGASVRIILDGPAQPKMQIKSVYPLKLDEN